MACTLLLAMPLAHAQAADDYGQMLAYLTDSRLDGQALSDASGAIAVNIAAGDANLQANLRSIARGQRADAQVDARQLVADDRDIGDGPMHATASIGGNALNGANGLVSINQASGSGNTELNVVTAALAERGIRETSDEALALPVRDASAGERSSQGTSGPAGSRRVAVESTALQGFTGVLQLNQIAGSGNTTSNQLGISVQATP
ncbi:hypothetical protein [Pseudoxanthomonas sp.]|uniref:hypothetical protein n=1 Tax=Pseudoxanthomonas sp. TaxID=1871049 RepID=UPI00260BAF3C|nr:hypothetical protein [Pseudoxanthomonas sp.]WDS38238.1 MAG: hypothetical protein O8I58_00060 [Pseudoxanthomonas sp.]